MSEGDEQLSLEMARKAVAEASAQGLGAVAAYAQLQLARAAAADGRVQEAVCAAIDAIPGLAVAAELGDAGLVLRWQGEPHQAWLGLSEASRDQAGRRAWLEGGIHAMASALDMACRKTPLPDQAALEEAMASIAHRPWVASSPGWSGVLAYTPPIMAGIRGSPPSGEAPTEPTDPDAVIWQTLARAVDDRRTVVQRYADSLGVFVSLATGGVDYRPLRHAAGRALLHVWRRALTDQPFLFRQPALRRQRLDELAPLINGGDLTANAEAFKLIADGVGVTLPWELDAWLAAPFEGVMSTEVVEE